KSSAEEKLYGMFPESNIHRIASKALQKLQTMIAITRFKKIDPSIYGNRCT
ncbi:Hypothetical protein FKW44_006583, partial [Caligus rogercresseyi]